MEYFLNFSPSGASEPIVKFVEGELLCRSWSDLSMESELLGVGQVIYYVGPSTSYQWSRNCQL